MNTSSQLKADNKDYSFSCTRLIAMILIVACHMMQREAFASDINRAHIEWAYWLNIGVQMFLYISGRLYGRKKNIHTVAFFKRCFPKLLVDYYVFIFAMLIVIHFSPLMNIDRNGIVGLLTFSRTVPGLGHLWFIPTILLCYFLTPIFTEILNVIEKRSNVRIWTESIILMLVVHILIKSFFGYFNPAWINCYFLGMIYSRLECKKEINHKVFTSLVALLCVIIIPLQFRLDYWPHRELPLLFSRVYKSLRDYGHVFGGIAVVHLVQSIFNKTNRLFTNHYILNWSDKYSYDVYLVHHVYVQSAFGCVEFIDNRLLALPLAIIMTIVSAVFIHFVSDRIRKTVLSC